MDFFQVLAIVADLLGVKSELEKWRQPNLSEIYVELLEQRIKDGTKGLTSTVTLQSDEFRLALSRYRINLDYLPITARELTNAIGAQVEELLLDDRIIFGIELDSARARAIIRDVHRGYEEEVFRQVPFTSLRLELGQINDLLTNHPELKDIKSLLYKFTEEFNSSTAKLMLNQEAMFTQMVEHRVEHRVAFGKILQKLEDLKQLPLTNTTLDSPPLPPVHYASREPLVKGLAQELENTGWLSLVGGTGRGKTHLARMVAEFLSRRKVFWISLRGRTGEQAHQHFSNQWRLWVNQLLAELRTTVDDTEGEESLSTIAPSVTSPVGWTLVIDELPDWAEADNGDLLTELSNFGRSLAESGGKLITTSQKELPASVKANLSEYLKEKLSPPLKNEDVEEIITRTNPPSRIKPAGLSALIQSLTEGHPALVAATIHWLPQHNWALDSESLAGLLQGEPLEQLRENYRRYMVKLLEERPRALLYRLSILHLAFDDELAISLAHVEPEILYPRECLDELTGIWLDQLHANQYEINPLLKDAGKLNIQPQTLRLVHEKAAEYYISRSPINVSDVSPISMHLWDSGQYEEFAQFLIRFGFEVTTPERAKFLSWLGALFSLSLENEKWETSIRLSTKIMFRATQVRILILLGADSQEIYGDLNRLIERAGIEEAFAVMFAYATLGAVINEPYENLPPAKEIKYCFAVVKGFQASSQEVRDALAEVLPESLEDFIWTHTLRIRSLPDIEAFLNEIRFLTQPQRDRLFSSELAVISISMMLDSLWLRLERETSTLEEWQEILKLLDHVHEIGETLEIPLLVVVETRSRAIIHANKLDEFDTALSLLSTLSYPDEPRYSFLINYTIGCIFYDKLRFQDAIIPFEIANQALTPETEGFSFSTKQFLCVSYGQNGEYLKAKNICLDALAVKEEDAEHSYEYLEMLGELSSIHWRLSERKKACAAMFSFVDRLMRMGDENIPRFREVFNKARHALGWYVTVQGGKEKFFTASGEDYYPVDSGFFAIPRKSLQDYASPLLGYSQSSIWVILGSMANNSDLSLFAWKAYRQSLTLAVNDNESAKLFVQTLVVETASMAARFGTPDEGVRIGISAVKAAASLSMYHPVKPGLLTLLTEIPNMTELWNSVPTERKKRAVTHFIYLSVFPLFSELLGSQSAYEDIEATVEQWVQALQIEDNQLERQEFAMQSLELMKQLLFISRDVKNKHEKPILLSNPEFGEWDAFWRLVSSSYEKSKTGDIFTNHLYALVYILKFKNELPYKSMLPGISRFILMDWIQIAHTRGFSLRQPVLFRQQLAQLLPHPNWKTGIQVLEFACMPLGVVLPKEISEMFKTELGS